MRSFLSLDRLDLAQKQIDAGGHLGGGELQDRQGFAIETAIPGNVSAAVNGLTFALVGTKGPWIVTADTQAPHVEPGSIPPSVAVEQP